MTELRWVLRRIGRRPLFAGMFVSIFGVSLGITLIVSALAESTIGSALPYDQPERLFTLAENRPEEGIEGMISSYRSLDDWRTRSSVFQSLGGVRVQVGTTMQTDSRAIRLSGAVVSSSMFAVLGVEPTLGRPFTSDEDQRGAEVTSVVVSHGFWSQFLGQDPDQIGARVTLNGFPWTVVGVLPAQTTLAPHHNEPVDVWFPMGAASMIDGPPVYDNRAFRIFQAIGRLRPGATEADLAGEVQRLSRELAADHPEAHSGWFWTAMTLRSQVLEGIEGPVSSLFAGGVVLFLVAVVIEGEHPAVLQPDEPRIAACAPRPRTASRGSATATRCTP